MVGQVVLEVAGPELAVRQGAVPRAALKGAAAVAVPEVAVPEVAVREVAVPAARQVGQVGLAVTAPRGPNVRAAPSES
ncbi:MAG: hypothetical protein WCH79_14330 [Planctomycetia bacterium]